MQAAAEHAQFLKIRKFASLDGLRCFSILAVVWHHATDIGKGFLGVQIFFAISGFLITTLLLRERRATGGISLPKFYARRSLRIFPLYYAVLLVYVVMVFALQRHTQPGQDFFHNLPFFATYTSNWFVPMSGRVIFYFSWSLATEEQFYLVVPSIEKFFSPIAVWFIILAVGLHIASGWLPLGVVIRMISTPLCLGVLAAHSLDHEKSFRYIAAVTWPKWCSSLWLIAVIACIWTSAQEVLLAIAMTGLVVSSVIRPDHGLARFLDWAPFQAVGRVSYGMYMLHQLCLNLIKRALPFPLPPFPLFALGSVVAFGAAWASYRWFESPFLRLKEHFASNVKTSQPVSSVVNTQPL